MRQEGLPVEGFCVAAGVPSTEKAAEIIEGLRNAGIKHVAFKPGRVDGIRQVVNIAASNMDFSSGPAVALGVIILSRISTSLFWRHINRFANKATFRWSRDLVLVLEKTCGHILPETVPSSTTSSPCHLMAFCSRVVSWSRRRHTQALLSKIWSLLHQE